MTYCRCGRKVFVHVSLQKSPKSRARHGKIQVKNHDMCQQCWMSAMSSEASRKMNGGNRGRSL